MLGVKLKATMKSKKMTIWKLLVISMALVLIVGSFTVLASAEYLLNKRWTLEMHFGK